MITVSSFITSAAHFALRTHNYVLNSDDMYGGEEDEWMDGPDEEDGEEDDGEEENDYSGYVSASDEWTDEEGPGGEAAEENNL